MRKARVRPSILVVDDEATQQRIFSLILADAGYEVTVTGNPMEALHMIETTHFDIVLTDLVMPGMGGVQFLKRARHFRPEQVVVMVTAHGTIPSAVEAMEKGAFHYLTKPVSKEELLVVLARGLERARLVDENKRLHSQLSREFSLDTMIGRHGAMQEVFRLVRKVAPTDTTVLIYGESGTGKELVAKTIHQMSRRAASSMHAVNCAAIPEALLESELFGYEKGAFTGAYAAKKGIAEQASGSTLFLDEVGDLGLSLQGKILRLLQEREIQRLGATRAIQVDVRIISATHRDLAGMMARGTFRDDLYYRLNTFPIRVPPLRERATDIPLFIEHFMEKFRNLGSGRVQGVSRPAMDRLLAYHWPGNVRQLESAIERALILTDGEIIEERHLPLEITGDHEGAAHPSTAMGLPEEGISLGDVEKRLLIQAMEKSGWVAAKAARLLGLTYRTLQYRLGKYGISAPRNT